MQIVILHQKLKFLFLTIYFELKKDQKDKNIKNVMVLICKKPS